MEFMRARGIAREEKEPAALIAAGVAAVAGAVLGALVS
jgi:hypothetical protein